MAASSSSLVAVLASVCSRLDFGPPPAREIAAADPSDLRAHVREIMNQLDAQRAELDAALAEAGYDPAQIEADAHALEAAKDPLERSARLASFDPELAAIARRFLRERPFTTCARVSSL